MLIDTLIDDTDREALQPVLERRARYLADRARSLAERPLDGDGWQTVMARASLHLETAEAMIVLDHADEARFALQLAIADYLELQMPFGAALQRAFILDHGSLASRADGFLSQWADRLLPGAAVAVRDTIPIEPERGFGWMTRAAETPQQWAYFTIAETLRGDRDGVSGVAMAALHDRLREWRAVPIGRLRFPIDHTLAILGRRPIGDVDGDHESVIVDLLAKQLVAALRAVQYARLNRYLWMHGFAPVPWFDFDLAILIALVVTIGAGAADRILDAVVRTVPADAASYAHEYLGAVQALRGDGRARPTGRFAS